MLAGASDTLSDIGGQTRQVLDMGTNQLSSHDDRSHSNDQFTALIRDSICSSYTTYFYSILSPPTGRREYCKTQPG